MPLIRLKPEAITCAERIPPDLCTVGSPRNREFYAWSLTRREIHNTIFMRTLPSCLTHKKQHNKNADYRYNYYRNHIYFDVVPWNTLFVGNVQNLCPSVSHSCRPCNLSDVVFNREIIVVSGEGEKRIPYESLDGCVKGIYFSAHWVSCHTQLQFKIYNRYVLYV